MSIPNDTFIDPPQRRGQLCCGCCCDYRRAVIIVDSIIVALEAFLLIILAVGGAREYVTYSPLISDELVRTEMIFSGVSIVTGAISIFGAVKYNLWLVLLNVLWLLIGYVAAIIYVVNYCKEYNESGTGDHSDSYFYYDYQCVVSVPNVLVQAVIMILWAYPRIGFMVQVKKGIMSEDTYEQEKHSCCCTSARPAANTIGVKPSSSCPAQAYPIRMERDEEAGIQKM